MRLVNQELESRFRSSRHFQELLSGVPTRPTAISFVNPFSYALVGKKPAIVEGIDHWFVDGAMMCWLTNRFRKDKVDRVSFDFSSIAEDVFVHASKRGKQIALIGGTGAELEDAQSYLAHRFNPLDIVYAHNGFFGNDVERQNCIRQLAESTADIVIVGMGTPKQEEFLLKIKDELSKPALLFTCGGFLTQTGLDGDFYPAWVKKCGARWFYRAVRQPHVRQRIVKRYPGFLISYLKEQTLKKAGL